MGATKETHKRIFEARASDSKLVAALAAATFFEAYVESDDPHDLAEYVTESFSADLVEKELESGIATYFLAAWNERPVGYAKLRRADAPECVEDRNSIELQRIYLFGRFTGLGLGRALVEKCVSRASEEGFSTLWLGVWEENEKARKFYRRLEFEQVGTVDFKYGNSCFTNLVMTKEI